MSLLPTNHPGTCVFDFDGTLVDSFKVLVKCLQEVGPRWRLRTFDRPEQWQELQGLNSKEVFKRLNVRWWRVPGLVRDVLRAYRQHASEVQLVDGMAELLLSLQSAGVRLAIVSSNEAPTIGQVLQRHGIDCFEPVIGSVRLKRKHQPLLQLKQRFGLPMIYVGDEMRDQSAAQRAGLAFVGVTWGHVAQGGFDSDTRSASTVNELRLHLTEQLG